MGVGWDEEEFRNLRLPFPERGKMSNEYIRIIKAAGSSDVPDFKGHYLSFANVHFSPRPVQRPHPPIWVGGRPGAISAPSIRRVAELCDAWHPLSLPRDVLEKGAAELEQAAKRLGRADRPGLAPRNALNLTDRAKGPSRAAFEGSPDEVVADIRRVQRLGAEYLTFDLPRKDVPTMARTMEQFAKEVKPALA